MSAEFSDGANPSFDVFRKYEPAAIDSGIQMSIAKTLCQFSSGGASSRKGGSVSGMCRSDSSVGRGVGAAMTALKPVRAILAGSVVKALITHYPTHES